MILQKHKKILVTFEKLKIITHILLFFANYVSNINDYLKKKNLVSFSSLTPVPP